MICKTPNNMVTGTIATAKSLTKKERFDENDWTHEEFDLTYTMRSVGNYMKDQKKRKELVLYNYTPSITSLDTFLS